MPKQEPPSRWSFNRSISLDSVIVLVVTIVSGLIFLITMNSRIDQQDIKLEHMRQTLERVEVDQKERVARIERDSAERSARLEAAIKEQSNVVQSVIIPRLQR